MKQKKRHEPAGQRGIHVRFRIAEPTQETADPARPSLSHESAWTQQVVLTPAGHDITKIDQPSEPPAVGMLAQEDIFRVVFASQNDWGGIDWNEYCGFLKEAFQPIQIFLRQAQALMPRPTSLDLSWDELLPSRLQMG